MLIDIAITDEAFQGDLYLFTHRFEVEGSILKDISTDSIYDGDRGNHSIRIESKEIEITKCESNGVIFDDAAINQIISDHILNQ